MKTGLNFHKGTITVSGDFRIPNTKWDERSGCYRGLAMFYKDIKDYLEESGLDYEDEVLELIPCPDLSSTIKLRPYQEEALQRWLIQKQGIIVLPTGSGKTYIGIAAISKLNCPSFIVVPTLDLVEQWIQKLAKSFDTEIGEFTGRRKELKPITVSTYNSAYLNAERLGNKFKLLIFDEVHHLAAEGYRHIAEFFASPYRLGLTATYERPDELHQILPKLIGGKIFELKPKHLTGKYLSRYELKKIEVNLTPKEAKEYKKHNQKFIRYIRKHHLRFKSTSDYQKIVMKSGSDPEAWEALHSREITRKIAYNSKSKIEKLRELLQKHRKDKVIIFTRYNQLVYLISTQFLIPCITHQTGDEERKQVLSRFRQGIYQAIVSSQVLDEGIDVPDANVGIILSGTGSGREFIQRLGRILRPKEERAILYEIVSKETSEIKTSYRRKRRMETENK